MTTDADVRHEYYVARGYLHALQVCFDRLDPQGADPAVTHALRIRTQDLAAELERVVMAGDPAAPSAGRADDGQPAWQPPRQAMFPEVLHG